MKYNDRGEELPDDTPIDVPVKFRRPPTLQEQIKAMVRREVSSAALELGSESFAEADDFDVDDDEALPPSNYHFSEMAIESRIGKQDASVLDKKGNNEDDGGAVNSDRTKESINVQQTGVGGDREGSSAAGKESAKARG